MKVPCKKCGKMIALNRYELCPPCKKIKCTTCGVMFNLTGKNSKQCYGCRRLKTDREKFHCGGVDGV